ncbi:glutamate ABC transporter substrate-binding protein [Nocardioides marmoraquaticus]
MRLKKTSAAVAALGLAAALSACGGNAGEPATGAEGAEAPEVEVVESPEFEAGTKMAELAEAGEVTIGVKFDQPGLGFKGATDDVPSGFDVEIAKQVAGQLGIAPEDITWEETISDNREPYLQQGRVDLVLATYSITDERRQIVGQTGPYLVTGQQLLVPEDSDVESVDDLQGEEVCAASGSTSLERIEEEGMTPAPADNYSACVDDLKNGSIAAVSTDGAILLGYAAENEGELKVVGEPFSEENIGVGYSKDSPEMCEFINEALQKSFDDGTWAEAYEFTLGGDGVEVPEPPALEDCQA